MSTVESLRDEVVQLLQELIRLNTVNPPGNESLAAEHLRAYLVRNGVESELFARAPGRANLVARIPGTGDGPSLVFLSHTDTVLADPAEWDRGPWSGELVAGEVWGRGALDMKGEVAASAVAIASLAREGFRPAGDLIFVAAADEEDGTDEVGLQWLVEAHPEAVRADYAVNEGGGDRVSIGGRVFYLCATAEKMSAPFKLRVRGRSGHASMPGIADNALVKAARLVEALGTYRASPSVGPEVAAFMRAVTGGEPAPEDVVARLREIDLFAADLIEPLLSLTVSPTMVTASAKRNVVPALCELTVDCRLLPGQQPEDVEPLIRAVLGAGDYELEWIERWGGTRSALDTPLWSALESWVAGEEPDAMLAPVMCAGFTDSHWLRDAFGTTAYGFFPARTMTPGLAARLVHSANERVPADDLELGVDFLRHVARSLG